MTDDEINRKVAEIEGWRMHYESIVRPGQYDWVKNHPRQARHGAPPYATDWELCGPLIEKYFVSFTSIGQRRYHGEAKAHVDAMFVQAEADTPQRAICLAVIAAQLSAIERGHRPK